MRCATTPAPAAPCRCKRSSRVIGGGVRRWRSSPRAPPRRLHHRKRPHRVATNRWPRSSWIDTLATAPRSRASSSGFAHEALKCASPARQASRSERRAARCSASNTIRCAPGRGVESSHAPAPAGSVPHSIPARCANPRTSASSLHACTKGADAPGAGGRCPPPQGQTLLIGAAPRCSRSRLTGQSCRAICTSFIHRRHRGASGPRGIDAETFAPAASESGVVVIRTGASSATYQRCGCAASINGLPDRSASFTVSAIARASSLETPMSTASNRTRSAMSGRRCTGSARSQEPVPSMDASQSTRAVIAATGQSARVVWGMPPMAGLRAAAG